MANLYYYDVSGNKIEVTAEQLKNLASQGVITPETIIENATGKQMRAGNAKGLTFAEMKQPVALSPVEQTPNDVPLADTTPAEAPTKPVKLTSAEKIGGGLMLFFIAVGIISYTIVQLNPSLMEENQKRHQEQRQHQRQQRGEQQVERLRNSFDRIVNGMSYVDVVSIAGNPTETIFERPPGTTNEAMYSWQAKDSPGAGFFVEFKNRKVVAKRQVGLR